MYFCLSELLRASEVAETRSDAVSSARGCVFLGWCNNNFKAMPEAIAGVLLSFSLLLSKVSRRGHAVPANVPPVTRYNYPILKNDG